MQLAIHILWKKGEQSFYNKLLNFLVFSMSTIQYLKKQFKHMSLIETSVIGRKPVPCNLNHSNSGNQPNANTHV